MHPWRLVARLSHPLLSAMEPGAPEGAACPAAPSCLPEPGRQRSWEGSSIPGAS